MNQLEKAREEIRRNGRYQECECCNGYGATHALSICDDCNGTGIKRGIKLEDRNTVCIFNFTCDVCLIPFQAVMSKLAPYRPECPKCGR